MNSTRFARVLSIICILSGLIPFSACNTTSLPIENPTAERTTSPASTNGDVVAACRLSPDHAMEVNFNVPGRVQEILVMEGQVVDAGEVLARLEGGEEAIFNEAEAQRQLLEANQALQDLYDKAVITTAEAYQTLTDIPVEIQQAEDRLETLQDNDASDEEIRQVEARLTLLRSRLVQAEVRYEVLQYGPDPNHVKSAEAAVTAAQARLIAVQATLQDLELKAPFSGKIFTVDIQVGQYLSQGQRALFLVDDEPWQVETTDLTELNVVKLQTGDPAVVVFDSLPDIQFPAIVESLSLVGQDREGDTFYTVWLKGDFQDARLRWKMNCSVSITPHSE